MVYIVNLFMFVAHFKLIYMNTNNENEARLSKEEQLNLIYQMINHAKADLTENGFLFLMWGWLVFFASVTQYICQTIWHTPYGALAWLLMPLGGIYSVFYSIKEKKNQKVHSYVDAFMKYIWTAFGVCLAIVLIFQNTLQYSTFPMVLMLYGIGTFITGGVLKFRPLIIGGIWSWLLAIGAFFVPFELQLLLLAMSVLFSYIVPGYILRLRYKDGIRRA